MYDARVTPHMYVIDARACSSTRARSTTARPRRKADIRARRTTSGSALESVMAGQPVKTPVTRAYGCTVKYS